MHNKDRKQNPLLRKQRDANGRMKVMRRIVGPVVVSVLLAVIFSSDAAEAGFFDGLINSMMGKVTSAIENVVGETTKKFSVLSGVFGENVTRGDLSLPEIINGAFSRNNGIWVGDNKADMDWKLGNGNSVIGAVSNGGSVGIISSGGNVSVVTSKTPSPTVGPQAETEDNGKDVDSGDESEPEDGDDIDIGTGEEVKDDKDEKEEEEGEGEEVPEASSEEDAGEEDVDEGYYELMSDWDAFVTSDIWKVQEAGEEGEEGSSGDSLEGRTSRVVNGVFFENRVPSGSSFGAKFFYNNEENFYCSGSLIGYPYILTAAHCGVVVGDQVRVGGRLLRSGYKATVGEVFLHPKFESGTLVHDLAIVRLDGLPGKRELHANGVRAARINKREGFPRTGFVGVLSGHGSPRTDGSGVSDGLQTTRQTVHELSKCAAEITQGRLTGDASYLCAGDGARSTTCVGDSGAGLWRLRAKARKDGSVRRWFEVFGVVSFGEVSDEALCPRGPPSVFQRTAWNRDWIARVVDKGAAA